jgi:LysM repeat protein
VGQQETHSKTNNPNQISSDASDPLPKNSVLENSKNRIISGFEPKKSQKSTNRSKKPKFAFRYVLHATFILGVVLAVGVGKVQSQSSLITSNADTPLDQTSMITTGAVLAESSSSLVNAELNQEAKTINSQTTMATAGNEFLEKRQPVLVGSQSREIATYVVQNGDTLSTIGQKFNITTDTIKWANNISDENSIKPGSKLLILPVSGVLYTATGGDDLVAVASQFQANAALIDSFNNLEGKSPSAGQKLIIPDGVVAPPAPAAKIAVATTTPKSTVTNVAAGFHGGGGSSNNSYSYGYCTWYVATRRYVPPFLGNASQWPSNARRAGMSVGSSPVAGAAGVARWGNHVVYIERVDGGTVYYTEMNGPAGWGRVNSGSASAGNFIYVY